MPAFRTLFITLTLLTALSAGCTQEQGLPEETFRWVPQSIAFQPPPGQWYREGDNGGGMLGVRFVLRNGGGQCISVLAYRQIADRDRREPLAQLIAGRDTLAQEEFLVALSRVKARTDEPISERELAVAERINAALDRARDHELNGQPGFAKVDLEDALAEAKSYELTLAEVLPRIRLQPELKQNPSMWRIGEEHDTLLAGHDAFASNDTLITPERPLLYREVYWVANGYGFKAVYQGMPKQLPVFERLVGSIRFPEGDDAAPTL